MKKQDYFLLFISGLIIGSIMLYLRPYTGYMDADYYFATAREIYSGHGFVQSFLWNYLDDPAGLPHPSFTYWMPLSALVSAFGSWVFQQDGLLFARLPFVLIFGFVPVLTGFFGYRLSSSRVDGWLAGLLSLFCGFYLRYITEPDSFSILMILGPAIILLLCVEKDRWKRWIIPIVIGILSGLIHLTRADGLIWLAAAGMGLFILIFKNDQIHRKNTDAGSRPIREAIIQIALLCLGYLLVTFPWYLRNLEIYHSVFPPGNFRTALITEYDQMFSYPATLITISGWWNQGLSKILTNMISAIGTNLTTALVIQGNIIMLPFMIIGIVKRREKTDAKMTLVVWVILFLAMSLIFPFAGKRGGYLHSIAALQPLLWVYSIYGLRIVAAKAAQWRNWNEQTALKFFSILFLCVSMVVSGYVVIGDRIDQVHSQSANLWSDYSKVDEYIRQSGSEGQYSVMVNDPPAYQIATRQNAYILPYGPIETMVRTADDFKVDYLVLDKSHTQYFNDLYGNPGSTDGLVYLGKIMDYHIYRFVK